MLALKSTAYRRFNRILLGFAAGLVLLIIAVNTRINPLWVTPTPWTDPSFAEYRPIYRHQRTGKAGIVRSTPWEAAFFGSSRVDIAFDPLHPGWQGKPVANLAVSAGTLPETAAILRYTLERCPLDTAIVGIDLGDISGEGSAYKTTGFMESPFNPKGDAVERELRYLGGVSTFETAVQTIRNKAAGELPEYTPQGHRLRHQDKPNVRQIIFDDAIPHAVRGTRRRKHSLDGASAWKTSLVRQILADTKRRDTRLVIVIPPNHAAYISVYFHSGDPDPTFTVDRGELVRLVAESNAAHPGAKPAEIWDFNDFHPLNCEPIPEDKSRMHWWLDGTHARKALGDVMLARVMGWPTPPGGADFGIRLTPETLAARDRTLREGYARLPKDHPAIWKFMTESVAKYQPSGDAAAEDEGAQGF